MKISNKLKHKLRTFIYGPPLFKALYGKFNFMLILDEFILFDFVKKIKYNLKQKQFKVK